MKTPCKHIAPKKESRLLGMALFGVLLAGCVEEYWPELGSKYEEVLVVDGMITSLPGPYIIKLSMSTSLERPEFKPVAGYSVIIMDDAGNTEELYDMNSGIYRTSLNGIQGIPGRSYKISITSPNGNIYESSYEKMEQPVAIDTMWAEYEVQESLSYDHNLEGYRFYISTKPAQKDTVYFLWKLDGTYQYAANHYIKYVFDGELKQFGHYDSLQTCWATYRVPEIFTHHTGLVSQPYLSAYPLHYVNTEDKKLSIRYSLLAEQLVISRSAHEYWKNVKKQNTEQGSLYANQPFQIQGNISNISDPDELVLGFFTIASIENYRIFVNRPWYAKFYYLRECFLITEDLSYQLWLMIDHWPVYLTAVYGEYGQSPALPVNQECVDCTKSGGTIVKPDFWIDNNDEKHIQ